MNIWDKMLGRKEKPEVDIPLKDQTGCEIGRLRINADGTFTGKLKHGSNFQEGLAETIRLGFSEGVMMTPLETPPTPPWKRN